MNRDYENEKRLVYEVDQTNKIVLWSTFVSSLMIFVASFYLGSSIGRSQKTIGFTMAFILSGGGAVFSTMKSVKRTEKLSEFYQKGDNNVIAGGIAAYQQVHEVMQTIKSTQSKADLVDSLPEYMQPKYIEQFGLQGVTLPTTNPTVQQTPPENTIQVRKQLPTFRGDVAKLIDTSWMNQAFFYSSGVVTGNEGSGKTQFLAMMALNIIAICPDVDLKIHNIHHNSAKKPWFPNMPSSIEDSYFIKDPHECYDDLQNVMAELQRREQTNDDELPPIVRIVDEFQGLADYLDSNTFADYLRICTQIKNRGRKWAKVVNGVDTGVRVILATHSIKKGETGLDSNFYNKTFVVLGDGLNDSAAMFPSDFNVKELLKGFRQIKSQLVNAGMIDPVNPNKDKARPAVTRINGNPTVVIIPRPDLTKIKYDVQDVETQLEGNTHELKMPPISTNEDWLEQLIERCRMEKKLPSESQVIDYVSKCTGKNIDSELAQKIIAAIQSQLGDL